MYSNILVVEDEQLVALDIQRRLTQLGHNVVALADRAEAALDAVAQFHPDVILMDIHLQGEVDGIATAVQIQAQHRIPIIFLTAHADIATVNRAKTIQPFGYLVKPVQTKLLNTAIEIALSRHQAEIMMQKALERERELSEALHRALEKEKEVSELKSQFVSIVSHEFRNPLSSLVFTLGLLERQDLSMPNEKRLAHVQRAKAAANNLTQLVDDILLLGETESVQFECRPSSIDILSFCHDLVAEFQAREPLYSLDFNVSLQSEVVSTVYSLDVKLVRHIVTNLLSNAVKYSPENSKIEMGLNCEPNAVTLCIRDHGIGIASEDQARLFEPFYRGGNVVQIPGTGLGLSITRKCVDIHRGTIMVESQLGVGTTFGSAFS